MEADSPDHEERIRKLEQRLTARIVALEQGQRWISGPLAAILSRLD